MPDEVSDAKPTLENCFGDSNAKYSKIIPARAILRKFKVQQQANAKLLEKISSINGRTKTQKKTQTTEVLHQDGARFLYEDLWSDNLFLLELFARASAKGKLSVVVAAVAKEVKLMKLKEASPKEASSQKQGEIVNILVGSIFSIASRCGVPLDDLIDAIVNHQKPQEIFDVVRAVTPLMKNKQRPFKRRDLKNCRLLLKRLRNGDGESIIGLVSAVQASVAPSPAAGQADATPQLSEPSTKQLLAEIILEAANNRKLRAALANKYKKTAIVNAIKSANVSFADPAKAARIFARVVTGGEINLQKMSSDAYVHVVTAISRVLNNPTGWWGRLERNLVRKTIVMAGAIEDEVTKEAKEAKDIHDRLLVKLGSKVLNILEERIKKDICRQVYLGILCEDGSHIADFFQHCDLKVLEIILESDSVIEGLKAIKERAAQFQSTYSVSLEALKILYIEKTILTLPQGQNDALKEHLKKELTRLVCRHDCVGEEKMKCFVSLFGKICGLRDLDDECKRLLITVILKKLSGNSPVAVAGMNGLADSLANLLVNAAGGDDNKLLLLLQIILEKKAPDVALGALLQLIERLKQVCELGKSIIDVNKILMLCALANFVPDDAQKVELGKCIQGGDLNWLTKESIENYRKYIPSGEINAGVAQEWIQKVVSTGMGTGTMLQQLRCGGSSATELPDAFGVNAASGSGSAAGELEKECPPTPALHLAEGNNGNG